MIDPNTLKAIDAGAEAAIKAMIRDHVFVPVRSNPSNCNECGADKSLHLFPKATG